MKRLALGFCTFVMVVLTVQASTMPAATVGGSGGVFGLPGMPIEFGFRFTPTVNLSVTALGTWDTSTGDIPSGAEVGLFGPQDAQFDPGPLLASVSYPGTTTYEDGFRYIDLTTAVTLMAGTQYTILSYFPAGTNIPEKLLPPYSFNADLSSVHFTNSYLNPGDGLTFVGTIPGGLDDYAQFGANFLFQAAAPTPEPGTLGLLILGLTALTGAGLRRIRVHQR